MLSSPRVLLVDDDPVLLECLTETLRLRLPSFVVDTCQCALDALSRIAETRYSLVISDLRMPGMDGLQLVRSIRIIDPCAPVVLITGAMPDDDLKDHIRQLGVTEVIDKPLERDTFLAVALSAIR